MADYPSSASMFQLQDTANDSGGDATRANAADVNVLQAEVVALQADLIAARAQVAGGPHADLDAALAALVPLIPTQRARVRRTALQSLADNVAYTVVWQATDWISGMTLIGGANTNVKVLTAGVYALVASVSFELQNDMTEIQLAIVDTSPKTLGITQEQNPGGPVASGGSHVIYAFAIVELAVNDELQVVAKQNRSGGGASDLEFVTGVHPSFVAIRLAATL